MIIDPRNLDSGRSADQLGPSGGSRQNRGLGRSNTRIKAVPGEYTVAGEGLGSQAKVTRDGRVSVFIDMKKHLPDLPGISTNVQEFAVDKHKWRDVPSLNIVICIVGSRGDVQPYVSLGKQLQNDGHRVRVASHETFRKFVSEENGLEFFDIGGDPHDLMSYMVKNPGLIPGLDSLAKGDIIKKRKMLAEMMDGCWQACHSADQRTYKPFIADAIISNPPAFAHIHCAEAMGVPLLMSFTMPWCSTTDFHHPLVNVLSSNAGKGTNSVLSYALFELVTWQGIGDLINSFRKKTLGLQSLTMLTGPNILERMKVPWTYCMSPALIPKPADWNNHIDVVGFYFLDLATKYQPPEELKAFLDAGEPPVYIGFGSVVVDDPEAMTAMIFQATKQAGVRALVSAGWGGLGGARIPDHVFILGNVPHDWLFSDDRVSAVVHHGGAGTTAIGLAKGRPTVVVPFFGDQMFWGEMIHRAGAGPVPIPHKELNVQNLTEAVKFAISPAAKAAAAKMAEQIRQEDGVAKGVESFYKHLPLLNMRCDLDPQKVAVWWSTELCLKISTFAAQVLADAGKLEMETLDLHRSKEYSVSKKIANPLVAGSTAIFWTITNSAAGLAKLFYSPVEGVIKTTTAIPRGCGLIVHSIYEGLWNMPTLYGSKVRRRGEVTDFSSGLGEGTKGLALSFWDGVSGLVTEPWEGAQKDGWKGALKGGARGIINMHMRPAAGLLGFVTNPINGAAAGIRTKYGRAKLMREQQSRNAQVRLAEGREAAQKSSDRERRAVLEAFDKLTTVGVLKERRAKYLALAESAFEEEQKDGEEDGEHDIFGQSHQKGGDTSSTSSAYASVNTSETTLVGGGGPSRPSGNARGTSAPPLPPRQQHSPINPMSSSEWTSYDREVAHRSPLSSDGEDDDHSVYWGVAQRGDMRMPQTFSAESIDKPARTYVPDNVYLEENRYQPQMNSADRHRSMEENPYYHRHAEGSRPLSIEELPRYQLMDNQYPTQVDVHHRATTEYQPHVEDDRYRAVEHTRLQSQVENHHQFVDEKQYRSTEDNTRTQPVEENRYTNIHMQSNTTQEHRYGHPQAEDSEWWKHSRKRA